MTHEEALNRVASILAHRSFEFIAAAETLDLSELRDETLRTDAEIAKALHIEDAYTTRLMQYC